MKKLLFSILLSALAIGAYAKDIQKLIVTTNPPLSCQNCENKIKHNIRHEKGITMIETNIPDQRVVVTYDADKTNPEKIAEGFAKIGYSVSKINDCCYPPSDCCTEGAECCVPIPLTPCSTAQEADSNSGATCHN